jgi:hypothetical protein
MNPHLVYIITQRRIAEFHSSARLRRLSGSLRRYMAAPFAGATECVAPIAEGGQLR